MIEEDDFIELQGPNFDGSDVDFELKNYIKVLDRERIDYISYKEYGDHEDFDMQYQIFQNHLLQ